jgi:hypothetical protein
MDSRCIFMAYGIILDKITWGLFFKQGRERGAGCPFLTGVENTGSCHLVYSSHKAWANGFSATSGWLWTHLVCSSHKAWANAFSATSGWLWTHLVCSSHKAWANGFSVTSGWLWTHLVCSSHKAWANAFSATSGWLWTPQHITLLTRKLLHFM